jgi:hypothetical protein
MNTVRKIIQSDDEGTLHVDLLVGARRTAVEVVITWQEITNAQEWPVDWFEETVGSISDDTFCRPPQGTFESRPGFG